MATRPGHRATDGTTPSNGCPGLSVTGLTPRFITAELTLADENPAMAALKPLAAESLAAAETAIDALWETDAIAA